MHARHGVLSAGQGGVVRASKSCSAHGPRRGSRAARAGIEYRQIIPIREREYPWLKAGS